MQYDKTDVTLVQNLMNQIILVQGTKQKSGHHYPRWDGPAELTCQSAPFTVILPT